MITSISIKSNTPTPQTNGPGLICSSNISVSAPPFEGVEFREARIFSRPGQLVMMELLFVCEKLPPNSDLFLMNGYCLYNDLKTGFIDQDCELTDWNATYNAKVGWYWIRVLCFVNSPLSIIAESGGHFDVRGDRDSWGAFSDYDQQEAKRRDAALDAGVNNLV